MKSSKFASLLGSPRELSVWTTGEPYSLLFDAEGVDDNIIDGLQNNIYADSGPLAAPMTVMGETHQSSFSPFSDRWSVYYSQSASQYSRISNNPADIELTGSFTIEVYFFLWSATTYKASTGEYLSRLISGVSDGSMELLLTGTTGTMNTVKFGRVGSAPVLFSNQTLALKRWHHLAVSRNEQGTISLFLNGIKIHTVASDTAPFVGSALFAGAAAITGKIGYWQGFLSNVRVINGSYAYDPEADSIAVPMQSLTAVQNTTVLALNKPNFDNGLFVPGQTQTYNSPHVRPFGPFPARNASGGSAYFDGSGDYLTVPDSVEHSPEGENFCIEAFAFFNTGAAECSIVSKLEGTYSTGFEWMLRLTGGSDMVFEAALQSGQTLSLSSGTGIIIPGQWYHIAVSRQGSVVSLFVNGYRVATTIASGPIKRTTSSVQVGKDLEAGQNRAMLGYISNCRLVKSNSVYDPLLQRIDIPTSNLNAVTGTSLLLRLNNAAIVCRNAAVPIRTMGTTRSNTSVLRTKRASIYTGSSGAMFPPAGTFGPGSTVEFWFRFGGSGAGGSFIEMGRSYSGWNTSQVRVNVTPYLVRYLSANSTTSWYVDTTTYHTLAPNIWHHFKYSGFAGNASIWINGKQVIFQPIGQRYGSTDFLMGYVTDTYIDEIKVY